MKVANRSTLSGPPWDLGSVLSANKKYDFQDLMKFDLII